MTDRPQSDPRARLPEESGRRLPPLVWILLIVLVAMTVIAVIQSNGTAPQGATVYISAGPTNGAAPTGSVNGPNRPTPAK
jgi:hypothetical protein